MSETVLASIIAGGFSVAIALLELTRRQNNRDHGSNAEKLDRLLDVVDRIEDKTDKNTRNHRLHLKNHHSNKSPLRATNPKKVTPPQ